MSGVFGRAVRDTYDMKAETRDIQLDIYRALIMIYIISVIHVAYWFDIVPEPWRSLILFEMPVVFFITGASLQVSRSRKSVKATLINRAGRVLEPYYIYALAVVLMSLVMSVVSGRQIAPERYLLALIPVDGVLPVRYCYHLWFILPYMVISCSFPLQQKIMDKIGRNLWLVVCLAVFISVTLLRTPITSLFPPAYQDGLYEFVCEIACYNVFMLFGFLFYRRLRRNTLSILALLVSAILLPAMLCGFFDPLPMQSHKFPPDLVFMIYGVWALVVLGAVLQNFKLRCNRIISWWNVNGYTLYLWQNIGYTVVAVAAAHVGFDGFSDGCWPLNMLVLAIMIFVVVSAVGLIAVRYERLCRDILKKAAKITKNV